MINPWAFSKPPDLQEDDFEKVSASVDNYNPYLYIGTSISLKVVNSSAIDKIVINASA
jgi:aspartokinase-like uncharacterized kinase